MIVLVCGGRLYDDYARVERVMNRLLVERSSMYVMHGGADGADALAGSWARRNGVQEIIVPANWEFFDKAAGPIRNTMMARLEPDLCVAFPGERGTTDMVNKALKWKIKVKRII